MKKYKVAIVSSGDVLESVLAAIDLDKIEVCAFFGIWDSMSQKMQNLFHKVFQPLDMLPVNCTTCGADYFLLDFPGDNWLIHGKLAAKGIDFKNIIIMEIFASKAQFNYSYFKQWKYVLTQPQLDFLVTGISYVRDAFDVQTMLPWRGINFARDSQDLYYAYKITETYLENAPPPHR